MSAARAAGTSSAWSRRRSCTARWRGTPQTPRAPRRQPARRSPGDCPRGVSLPD